MPMIDVYATVGTFPDKHELAQDLANAVMRWGKVPPINRFKRTRHHPSEDGEPLIGLVDWNRFRDDAAKDAREIPWLGCFVATWDVTLRMEFANG